MKKVLIFILCALMVLTFAACGEKAVSNDHTAPGLESGDSGSSATSDDGGSSEDDDALLNIQDIIGFWNPISIYQAPRATDNEYSSDEEALEVNQGMPVQISASEFDCPIFYTDKAVFTKVSTDLDSLDEYGIQVDETLETLVGDGQIVRLDISEEGDDFVSFNVFIINGTTMLYQGDGGYFFLAELEESVG